MKLDYKRPATGDLIKVQCPKCGITWLTNIPVQRCLSIMGCLTMVSIKTNLVKEGKE